MLQIESCKTIERWINMRNKMKKGINIWSFPGNMRIEDCMRLAKKAGFEGIELALALKGSLSLKSSDEEIISYKKTAKEIGIDISSLATGLYWQYSFTSNQRDIRQKAIFMAKREIEVGALLGVDCVLVCPGTVGVDFKPDEVVPDANEIEFFAGSEVIDYDIAYKRAQNALKELAPYAKDKNIIIGVENIWNKFLLSPLEMRNFIDEIDSENVQVYFDVGNVLLFGYPQQWIRILNNRIKSVHFKDFRRGTAQLSGFVDLLTGDVEWGKVIDSFNEIGYDGWVNAEMCPPYKLYGDQNIYNASNAMDRILNQK